MRQKLSRPYFGTPLVTSLFHEGRWDYVFTLKQNEVEPQRRRLTVYFKGDLLERFESDPLPLELEIPTDLFDRVAENCLQNALEKRRAAPQVQIHVRLAVEAGPQLTVCDSGDALPEFLARTLFTAPVPSAQGLGVGLYQAARQAAALGYRLALARNRLGEVCFALSHDAATAVTAADRQLPSG